MRPDSSHHAQDKQYRSDVVAREVFGYVATYYSPHLTSLQTCKQSVRRP
jgi:hypothetical protein